MQQGHLEDSKFAANLKEYIEVHIIHLDYKDWLLFGKAAGKVGTKEPQFNIVLIEVRRIHIGCLN
jgi:hypothetical protein